MLPVGGTIPFKANTKMCAATAVVAAAPGGILAREMGMELVHG